MLKKIQLKFMILYMLMVTLVTTTVSGVQLWSTWQRAEQTSQTSLTAALQVDELTPSTTVTSVDTSALPTAGAEIDGDGHIISSFTQHMELDETTMQQLIDSVIMLNSDSGITQEQNLRYQVLRDESGTVTRVAFVQRTWEQETMHQQLVLSGCSLLAALLVLFFLGLFLSKWVAGLLKKQLENQLAFMTDAAQQLKAPMAVILSDVNILMSHPKDTVESQRKWIAFIDHEAEHAKVLISDLLFLTKCDTRWDDKILRNPLVLSDLIWKCLLPFEAIAQERDVILEGDVQSGLKMRGNEEMLRRMVIALLDNACKYAGEDGTVRLVLKQQKEGLLLSVHNNGDPIPQEEQLHIFKRFYRGESTPNGQNRGHGLGLAVAKTVVEAHGGTISVTSGIRTGTTFTALLPQK